MASSVLLGRQERRNHQAATPAVTTVRAALVLTVLAATVVLVLVSSPSFGYKIHPLFDLQGTLSVDRLHVVVSGPFGCTPEEGDWEMHVTVTQEATRAAGVGTARGECQGGIQTFTIDVTTPEGGTTFGIPFQEGPALVCGFGTTKFGSGRRGPLIPTSTTLWCHFITLVRSAG